MENKMFNMAEPSISQDQSLALQSQVLAFVREALIYDKDFVVFAVKELGTFEFEFYHTDGKRINALYEETREETIDRILFTIDCSQLCKIKGDTNAINDIMKYLYNYVVGVLSVYTMHDRFDIVDRSNMFRDTYFEQH